MPCQNLEIVAIDSFEPIGEFPFIPFFKDADLSVFFIEIRFVVVLSCFPAAIRPLSVLLTDEISLFTFDIINSLGQRQKDFLIHARLAHLPRK